MEASERKEHIKWNIMQNPVEITIQRTQKIRSGGGYNEIESTVGPFTVRLYIGSQKLSEKVTSLAGTKKTDPAWGLLADHNADIKSDPNIIDEFDVPVLGHFIVVTVFPQTVNGEIVGYQADLERVS